MNTRNPLPDDLVAPCAVEGATFRDPAPIRPHRRRAYESAVRIGYALLVALLMGVCVFASRHAAAAESCDWSEPGRDRYTGEVPAALEHYQDIPAPIRARLAARMAAFDFDEVVTITATGITGHYEYAPELWGMHYGTGRICLTTTRARLQGDHYGLAYTEGDFTIIVPNDCGNVSRATRLDAAAPPAQTATIEPSGPIVAPVTGSPPERFELVSWLDTRVGSLGYAPWSMPIVFYGPPGTVFVPSVPSVTPPVPEPSTWLLMLAGVLWVWLVMLRRSRR